MPTPYVPSPYAATPSPSRAICALLRAFADGIASRSSFCAADRHPTDVSDDEITTGKIAVAYLNKFPDYYTRVAQIGTTDAAIHGRCIRGANQRARRRAWARKLACAGKDSRRAE